MFYLFNLNQNRSKGAWHVQNAEHRQCSSPSSDYSHVSVGTDFRDIST